MSTRATVHFTDRKGAKPTAIIYRHSDGYPNGLGKDLEAFIQELKDNVPDNRFGDPSYLAAKWVVWDTLKVREQLAKYRGKEKGGDHPLNFLGVGVVNSDPGDIEHRYTVICNGNGKQPKVIHEKV